MTRTQIATELLKDCPTESLADHKAVAAAVESGAGWDALSQMPELNRWPESYSWLRGEMLAAADA